MSRGTKVVISYAPQTDVATIPADGWRTLPRKSDSLNNKVELKDSETLNDSRLKTPGMPVSADAEGDVEVEFIRSIYDDLIAAAAGNDWDGDTLTFGGDIERMFAIQKANTDIEQYHIWRGARVNSFKLNISASDYIGMTFGFMASGYSNALTPFATGVVTTATAPKATSLSVEDIKIGGETLQKIACVSEFTFELTNNIENIRCLGSGMYGAALLAMMADMTGSVTVEYSRKTQELINLQLTGATVPIDAVIKFPNGDKYALHIPKAQLSGDLPSGGKDKLSASLAYTVVGESVADLPTLTRTITP